MDGPGGIADYGSTGKRKNGIDRDGVIESCKS